eukprot:CAMPEP_0174300694 /NCGR_PEP_ID=MMETSP0809-20121228/58613_1 /TAXON_ID=73025 ORGANISM="Eutreptiella gymnastica-like, Strain CCMP1594" /NCGR_SAMPLE_ID=MMETSP0809 /ASSEMBLY_ACC=CAM_ASM_000658 /LENGTH=68 /DNA_ID=CAMNT_0015406317 /DNA_START=1556 /DNA_END=1762 /DNA_ORIENTATION=-
MDACMCEGARSTPHMWDFANEGGHITELSRWANGDDRPFGVSESGNLMVQGGAHAFRSRLSAADPRHR